MALLGKISAVLTASTADFTRKISLAKNDLAAFQKRVSGIQLNLNTRALDGTLTKLQKFKREVDELRRLRSLGVDLGFDPRRLTDQFKAFEEIGKPLTDVKNKIEGLSLSIQAELYPELEKVSSGFRNLYRDIETGATTWDKSEKRANALASALTRLSRATAAASDIGRLSSALRQETAGASFFQPRTQESLQRSRSLRDQAAQIPARFRSDAFADLADSADRNAGRIERQAARVIAIEARIARQGATPNLLNARSVAQGNLDSLTSRQEAINAGFQRQIRESRLAQVISPEQPATADLLAARLEKISTQLRAINGQQFEGLISGATAVVRQFNAGETSAKKAKQAVDALAASLNSVNTSRNLANQTRSLLFSDAELRRQQIQSDFDRERSAGVRGAEQRRDVNLTRERLNNEIIPNTRILQRRASESGDAELARRAENLTQLSRRINNELRNATNQAGGGRVDAANQSIARANTLLERQLQLEQQISRELDEINAARRQQDMFLEASGGRGELLSQGARDAAADISTARQFRGQIADGASRNRIQREIERVTQAVTGLQREMARVENSDLGADERIAELDRLDRAVRQTTAGLARTVAQNSGGAFSEARVADAMRLARNTAGSLSTRGAASAQLAIQQGLFAIDDLISSTGGLEYKLRAVGNNITQLGLLLGQSGLIPGLNATTGLFIGLAAVIGGQVAASIARFVFNTEEADQALKFLNDELKKSKNLAEENKKAFLELADAIEKAGRGGGGFAARGEIEDELRRRRERRRDEADAIRGSTNRRASATSARVGQLEKQLEEASAPADRALIRVELERARVAQRQARVASRESFNPREAGDSVRSSRAREAEVLDALSQLEAGGFGFLRPDVAQRNRDRRERIARETVADPRTAKEAESLISSEISQLSETLTRGFGFFDRQFAAIDPGIFESSGEINKIRQEIARLEEQRGKLEAQAAEESGKVYERLEEISLVAARNIEGTTRRIAELRLDADLTSGIESEFLRLSSDLAEANRGAQEALEKGLDASEFEKSANEAAAALERLYQEADAVVRDAALRKVVSTEERLGAARSAVGDLGPSVFGTALDNAIVDLQEANSRLDRARTAGNTAEAQALETKIEALRENTSKLEEGAIALQSFQRAVEAAALSLSDTLVSEARSLAERARREANAAFGEGTFDRSDVYQAELGARARQRDEERSQRELENQLRQERLRFEQEIQAGNDPAAQDLLRRVREGNATADNRSISAAEREAGRRDAADAQAQLDMLFEQREGVQRARAEADQRDIERARREAAARRSREAAGSRLSLIEGNQRSATSLQLGAGNAAAFSELADIAKQIEETRDALERAEATQSGAGPAIQKRLDDLEKKAADLLESAIVTSVERAQNTLADGAAQERAARQELERGGVFASDIQGRITENEIRRQQLVQQRDAALGEGNADVAAARQAEIDAIDSTTGELNATAIALSAFQQAARDAALALREQLASESRGTADRARRDASAAEATFGPNSPFAKEARERQREAEIVADRAERQRLEADAAIANERVKFEQELQANPASPEAQRARRIQELEQRAADERLSSAEREAARAEAASLRAQQEADFRDRPGVQQAQADADQADADMQRAASANRALERAMTQRQRQEREAATIAGDLKNLFDTNQLGRNEQQRLVNDTFRNEAERVAPMLVGFTEARQNALLQGPSRAALQATDITTSQGAAELNRLLRGDDAGRDANLVELRKQSQALNRIVDEIRNATGLVVTAET